MRSLETTPRPTPATMRRQWVVDASPAILLAKVGHIGLLPACADTVLIPEPVAEEIQAGPPTDPARAWLDEEGHRFVQPTGAPVQTVAAWDLGRGERAVLSFAAQHSGWIALVDDGAARRCASALDIDVLGTLGVLVIAYHDDQLSHVRPVIQDLQHAGMHIHASLVDHVLSRIHE